MHLSVVINIHVSVCTANYFLYKPICFSVQFVFTVCSPWGTADIRCCWRERLALWSGWSQTLAPDQNPGSGAVTLLSRVRTRTEPQGTKTPPPHRTQPVDRWTEQPQSWWSSERQRLQSGIQFNIYLTGGDVDGIKSFYCFLLYSCCVLYTKDAADE